MDVTEAKFACSGEFTHKPISICNLTAAFAKLEEMAIVGVN